MKVLEEGNIENIDMYYRCNLDIAFICDGCGECWKKIGLKEMID